MVLRYDDKISTESKKKGLNSDRKKTDSPIVGKRMSPKFTLQNIKMKHVHKFKYLGNLITVGK